MKKSFMLILLSVFFFSALSPIYAEEDDYHKGLVYYKKHNYEASIKHLKTYAEKTPDPRAYYLIGYASYKLKDYSTASRFFRDTFLIDPDFKPSLPDLQ